MNIRNYTLLVSTLAIIYILRYTTLLHGLAYYIVPAFISIFLLVFLRKRITSVDKPILASRYIYVFTIAGILPYYFMGFIFGFGINILSITPLNLVLNALLLITTVIVIEIFRYSTISALKKLNTMILLLVSIAIALYEVSPSKLLAQNPLFVLELLTLIMINIPLTLLSYYYNFKYLILARVAIFSFLTLSPILPDLHWFITINMNILVVLLQLVILYKACSDLMPSSNITNAEYIGRTLTNKVASIITKIVYLVVISILVIGLLTGYKLLVVLSSSMHPTLDIGDLVLVSPSTNMKEGDIIAFNIQGQIVIHRLIKIEEKNGKRIYYTKGDAVTTSDPWLLTKNDIIGKYMGSVPKLGMPLIFLIEIFGGFVQTIMAIITFILFLNIMYITRILV